MRVIFLVDDSDNFMKLRYLSVTVFKQSLAEGQGMLIKNTAHKGQMSSVTAVA